MPERLRDEIRALVAGVPPVDLDERATIAWVLQWIDADHPLFRVAKPATPPVHLVSYFLVVDGEHVLLVDHRDAGLWLPTGGHVEPHEHPMETVRREVREELGVDAVFARPTPFFVTKTRTVGVSAGHTDVSLWYLLRGERSAALVPEEGEFRAVAWMHRADVPFERAQPDLRRAFSKLWDLA